MYAKVIEHGADGTKTEEQEDTPGRASLTIRYYALERNFPTAVVITFIQFPQRGAAFDISKKCIINVHGATPSCQEQILHGLKIKRPLTVKKTEDAWESATRLLERVVDAILEPPIRDLDLA